MRDLACTYCGGMLAIRCEYVGRAYLAENKPVAIECDGPLNGYGCGAEWDVAGSELTPGRSR